MKPFPKSDNALVIRTDYSDQRAWDEIRQIILTPVDGFLAYVDFIDDPEYADISKAQVMDLHRENGQSYAMIADGLTISNKDHPLLIVDLFAHPGAEFRAEPGQIQSVQNNLSLANLDFSDFVESIDESGVFRGFHEF